MNKPPKRSELGELLKHWRGARGRSQLDISVDAGISQRQISFIESGRSIPTRAPQAVASQELRVECMYPADDETEVLHAKLLAESSTSH